MTYYGKGCYEVHREVKQKLQGRPPERGKIKMQSKKSLLRLMFLMQATEVEFKSMITFTYPKHYPMDGNIVKLDIGAVLQKVRREEWQYLWFLEFQKRGAPHFHLLVTADVITPKMRVDFGLHWTARIALREWYTQACPPDEYMAEVLKMAKFNTHYSSWELIRDADGARNYVAKYAGKERQKRVPARYASVGRFWGASRGLKPKGLTFDVTEKEVEQWLVDHKHPSTSYELVPRYIWQYG